ncbi:MAG: hypothetical protein HY547_04090, partial [Elusimicrobia bacterium]|nr:hypothetical protein [Elusimicrobiota bacterium]
LRLRQAPSKETSIFSYYLAEVLRDLSKKYPEGDLMRLGFRIYTAMDPDLQETLGRAAGLTRHQAALIALDPASGYILALVGGRDFSKSQFNRATQAKRQPGSAFKPLVYAAALEQGWTPASTVLDEQRSLKQLKKTAWEPKNFDGVYHGTVTLRQALSLSLNAATVELSQKVGLAGIVQMARRLGIESLLKEYPALALGTFEVSLVEITAAYAPFANGGWSIHPTLIMAMLDSNGATLEFSPVRRSPALDPASANLMTSLLESAVTEGTGRGLAKMGWDRKAAGKTGTTDEGRDAWFIGYTPELLCGVWVGDDEHRAINVSGAKDALPLWAAFMKEALAEYPPSDFATPEGLVSVVIDPLSGLLATGDCPERKKELFAAGTEPTAKCPLHRKDNLFDRLRQWWKK